MPSVMAKCCAGLRRILRALVAPVPLVGPSPAPIGPPQVLAAPVPAEPQALQAPQAPVDIPAPPLRALTQVQEEFEMAMKAAKEEMQERVKHYKALNGGGTLTKSQEMDIRNSAFPSHTLRLDLS